MGSLMGGWGSPVDPKSVKYQRNRSCTKGEIEAYWRSKKKTEEEHLRAISGSPESIQESTTEGSSGRRLQKSSSFPPGNTKESFMDVVAEANLEKLIKKNAWWTRSNWAFLNEEPHA